MNTPSSCVIPLYNSSWQCMQYLAGEFDIFICHLNASSDMTCHVLTTVLSCVHNLQYTALQVRVENPDPEMTLLYFLRNERILLCNALRLHEISPFCDVGLQQMVVL